MELPLEILLFAAQSGLATLGLSRFQLQGAGRVEQDLGLHPKGKDMRLDEHGLTTPCLVLDGAVRARAAST